MSLLDDVSVVVTPNGYKAGELYAVIPVPTEGSELVVNGDFATETVWTFGGTTFSVGAVLFNSYTDNLFQNLSNTVNTIYKLTITKTGTGTLRFRTGYAGSAATKLDIPESGIVYFTSTSDTNRIQIYGDENSVSATLNSVSVKEWTGADMDVTRATAATRVDENGLVNYAEILGSELVTNGDFATDTDWAKGAGWTISGGTASNSGGANFSDLTQNNANITIGKNYKITYTVSNYVSGSFKFIMNNNTASGLERNADGTYTDYISALSQGYSFRTQGSGFIGSIDNISVKQEDKNNVPRIDYTGGGCPHILAEPQRTNLITYSEDFTNGIYGKVAAGTGIAPIVTSNYAISPNGTQSADRIQFNLNGGTSSGDTSYITTSLSAGTIDASVSIYLKTNDSTTKDITLRLGTSLFDYDVTVTSEWQRFSLSGNTNVDRIQLLLYGHKNSQTADLSVWGLQAEAGSYPTSYILTSGSAVTRNQDIFTRDGIGSLINSSEGVLFVEMAALSDDLSDRRLSLNDGSNANEIRTGYSRFTGNIISEIVSGGSVQNVNWGATGVTQTNNNKFALSWGSGTLKFYVNGSQTNIETGITSPVGLNNLKFSLGNDSLSMFAKVKQLQVYKTALTNAQLISLTS